MSEHAPNAGYDRGLTEQMADAMRTSRLFYGTHADRWNDAEWQREFWAEAATVALTVLGVKTTGEWGVLFANGNVWDAHSERQAREMSSITDGSQVVTRKRTTVKGHVTDWCPLTPATGEVTP